MRLFKENFKLKFYQKMEKEGRMQNCQIQLWSRHRSLNIAAKLFQIKKGMEENSLKPSMNIFEPSLNWQKKVFKGLTLKIYSLKPSCELYEASLYGITQSVL